MYKSVFYASAKVSDGWLGKRTAKPNRLPLEFNEPQTNAQGLFVAAVFYLQTLSAHLRSTERCDDSVGRAILKLLIIYSFRSVINLVTLLTRALRELQSLKFTLGVGHLHRMSIRTDSPSQGTKKWHPYSGLSRRFMQICSGICLIVATWDEKSPAVALIIPTFICFI